MNLIGKIIAVVTIIIAIYTFDWHTFNQIVIPILLMMSATLILLKDKRTPFARKLNDFLVKAGVVLAVILILKMIFIG